MEQTTSMIDIYAIVTNRIIELLKMGTVPWRKPWTDAGLPRNLLSGRLYRGINVMLLNAGGFKQNLFLTWNQIKTIKASVIPGEKGTLVIFQKWIESKKEGEVAGKKQPFLRYYKVFNVAQCKDIPKGYLVEAKGRDNSPLWTCEQIVENMKDCPLIKHEQSEAYYSAALDCINLPDLKRFKNSEAYYSTLFHELIHSTGHQKRIGRKAVYENPEFGSDAYSMEELIAEMGTCYLQSYAGIPIEELGNNAAYIHNWLQVFEGDNQFVIKAASYAQRAVDYILQPVGEQKESNLIIETHWG